MARIGAAPAPQAVIALDLGGTKLASGLFVGGKGPIARRALPLASRQGDKVAKLILSEVRRLEHAASRRGWPIRAVGISVPGIARRNGCVWAPNIPGWDDYPLRGEIQHALSDSHGKVVVESDRAASILGEAWRGAARGCRNAVFLAVGTGIGAGMLIDGRLLRGAHDIAGAIGWLALDRPFQAEYEACGCLESNASGEGIAKAAKVIIARRKGYRGPLRSKSRLTAHDVFAAYERADVVAKEVLAAATEFWGMASANLVSLLNPEMIVFGGGVFGPASRFLEAIAVEARRWAQPVAVQHVKFEISQLGGDAALYGAAYVASRGRRSRHS
jgi:glucokinase